MNETATASPLDAIIAEYIQAVEAGTVPSREDLLAKHHNLAADLQAFFADYDRMDNRADAFKLTTKPAAVRPTVKYIGDYELLEEIAEGGMGLVYKARQVSLSRVVALKLVRAGHLAKPLDVARFRIEAEAAAGLDHPNIVPIHEVGEHEGQQYLVMKFIDGPTLANLPRGDIRTEVARLHQVVQAVDSAHRQGILHRDIKPSNILTDSAGTPFVTDFGLAKRMDADLSLTETGQSVGTAGYWSPEQALGKKGLNVTTDVFSLGAVLYERLTGKMAFPGATHLERLRSLDNDPSRPTYLVPTLPRDLETVCLKCLEREPSKRYPGADELAEDLARWLRGEPITARRTTNMERFWLWCRRNPAIAGWAGATVAALLIGIVISTAFGVKADRRRIRAELAEDRHEQALARAYLRPLNPKGDTTLMETEVETLWDIAMNTNTAFAIRILEESLRHESAANQVAARAQSALIATIGLDQAKRKQALELLWSKLTSSMLSDRHKASIAWIAICLGDAETDLYSTSCEVLVQSLKVEREWRRRWLLTNRIVEASARMDVAIASSLLLRVIILDSQERKSDTEAASFVMESDVGQAMKSPANALAAIMKRSAINDKKQTCNAAIEAIYSSLIGETDRYVRRQAANDLCDIAGVMNPTDALKVLLRALESPTNYQIRSIVAEKLVEVVGQMVRENARETLTNALKLSEAVDPRILPDGTDSQSYYKGYALASLSKGLATIVPIVEKGSDNQENKLSSQKILTEMAGHAKANQRLQLNYLTESLLEVAEGMDAQSAKHIRKQAIDMVVSTIVAESENDEHRPLERCLISISVCADAGYAADQLINALKTVPDPWHSSQVAQYLSFVGQSLEMNEADRVAKEAITAVLGHMRSINGPDSRWRISRGIGHLAKMVRSVGTATMLQAAFAEEQTPIARGELAEALGKAIVAIQGPEVARLASEASRIVAETMRQEPNKNARRKLMEAIGMIAIKMDRKVSKHLCRELANSLVLFIENEDDRDYHILASALSTVARHLEPEDSARSCRRAINFAHRCWPTVVRSVGEVSHFEYSISQLCDGLSGENATMVAWTHSQRICGSGDCNVDDTFRFGVNSIDALDRLLTDRNGKELSIGIANGVGALGIVTQNPMSGAIVVHTSMPPLPCRLTTQQLVELMKYPTCVGSCRQVILKHLGNRFGRTFDNHWQFIKYSDNHGLRLDFKTPPRQPQNNYEELVD